MPTLHGLNLLGNETAGGGTPFRAVNPAGSLTLEPEFFEANDAQVDRAMTLAESAFDAYRHLPAQRRAAFLEAIASEIERCDGVIERANQETGLPIERLKGERGRTVGQLRMFARLIEEGSWVDARIDGADPSRKPAPKPDLRRMLIPMGPVVVFAASNFPLAFSVAGGDMASALAAGCPVVVKTHPAHPGASEIVGALVIKAAQAAGMPEGVFSLLHGRSHAISLALVRHPLTRAVGFTGSLRGGRALFDAACTRPDPIPVYAEMGSINPIFVLPGALAERSAAIAEGLRNSVTMGVGQFCTNPGLIVGLDDPSTRAFAERATGLFGEAIPGTMLYAGLRDAFEQGLKKFTATAGVRVLAQSRTAADPARTHAGATLLATDARTFLSNRSLSEELFGPATLLVTGSTPAELEAIARGLDGHLTATLHGTARDLESFGGLVSILERKVGRLLFNGFPTGVEVAPAMQHGGPYPATTDARTTSVGTAAIERFVRPICYQDFTASALPEELRDDNPRKIWRLVDGQRTREHV
jgi:NADP-dependent aldehyde dehydrogenase